jgi:hypothetical protein
MSKTKLEPRYSGDKSKKFWKRINAIPRIEGHLLLYTLGCALQDLEGRVLGALEDAEKRDGTQPPK